MMVDFADIPGKTLFTNDVKMINISIGGVLLKTDRRMNIEKTYTLELKNKSKFLTLQCNVVWFTLSESYKDPFKNIIPIYTVGMNFTDVSSEKMKEISDFIKDYFTDYQKFDAMDLYRMSSHRLNMRFYIGTLDSNTAYCYYNYKVINISLGGMFIESEDAMEIEDRYLMEIVLPEYKVISFLGRIVTCTLANIIGKKRYEIGIEFIDMLKQDKRILKEFILFY
ncbi:MAG: PilZ domain-containing protein [Nitrospirae bacterium]|nr:PilZ domain-containing protein [Nitrospirota bacterium]